MLNSNRGPSISPLSLPICPCPSVWTSLCPCDSSSVSMSSYISVGCGAQDTFPCWKPPNVTYQGQRGGAKAKLWRRAQRPQELVREFQWEGITKCSKVLRALPGYKLGLCSETAVDLSRWLWWPPSTFSHLLLWGRWAWGAERRIMPTDAMIRSLQVSLDLVLASSFSGLKSWVLGTG